MNMSASSSVFPERFRILSGSMLKLIAIVIMFIDHGALVILSKCPWATEALFSLFGKNYSLYRVCRDVGRAAFPIFCFLLVEGFLHTRSRRKYGMNLLVFAAVSEIPWNFMFTDTWRYEKQNVFFTLFLGYLGLCALEYFWENQAMQLVCLAALFFIAYNLNADYGWRGFIFILIMYLFRSEKAAQALIGSCWLYYEWKACFAFISINMYNGERGFIKGKAVKFFFYWFYPLHIALLVILRRMLF